MLALLFRATVTAVDAADDEADDAEGDGEAGGRRRRVAALRPEDIGVMVPYRAQAGAIQRVMKVGLRWGGVALCRRMDGLEHASIPTVPSDDVPFTHRPPTTPKPQNDERQTGEGPGDAGPLRDQGGDGGLLPGRGAGGDRLQLRAHHGPRLPRLPAPVRVDCVYGR